MRATSAHCSLRRPNDPHTYELDDGIILMLPVYRAGIHEFVFSRPLAWGFALQVIDSEA